MAILHPKPPKVTKKALGLISGDEIKNTITGAMGAPAASIAATAGRTPMAQRGLTRPRSSAPTIAHAPARLSIWATVLSNLSVDMMDAISIATTINHHSSTKIFPAVIAIANNSLNMLLPPLVESRNPDWEFLHRLRKRDFQGVAFRLL